MKNVFSMVTLKASHDYTNYAIDSFFKNTKLNDDDDFLLIDNDQNKLDKISNYKKIDIIKNKLPMSFAQNVNQAINFALKKKKNLFFLNNDIIFTEGWIEALNENSNNVLIPVSNQMFSYESSCGNLKLKPTMSLKDFNENYLLLNEIVRKHKKKYQLQQKAQGLLMPFFCFKIPYKILNEVGLFDEIFIHGGEDVDYRIRCAKKGYDTYFILDSYLLHFHGKSSWDGAETDEQIKDRGELYTEAFSKKWGKEMTQIFIYRENFKDILNKKELVDLFKKGKYGELIRKLIL
jgi:GT2 family glycosyltransferase